MMSGRKKHKLTDLKTQIEKHACLCVYMMKQADRHKWKTLFASMVGGRDEDYYNAVRELTYKKLKVRGLIK